MTDEEKTQFFIDLYMTALRAFYNNEFLKEPNPTSERYKQLDKARQIVDANGGEYSEFINLQFQAFRKMKIAPKPHHLISEGAIKRYQSYQMKHNSYNTKEYTTHGDYLTVKKSRITYPISQILLPVSQDTTALHAYNIPTSDAGIFVDGTEEDRDALYYLEAKLKYKGVEIPESIKKLLKEA